MKEIKRQKEEERKRKEEEKENEKKAKEEKKLSKIAKSEIKKLRKRLVEINTEQDYTRFRDLVDDEPIDVELYVDDACDCGCHEENNDGCCHCEADCCDAENDECCKEIDANADIIFGGKSACEKTDKNPSKGKNK